MKTGTTILLLILALGMIVAGCSKTPAQTTQTDTQALDNTANVIDDLAMDEVVVDPDIGTLDEIAVSDELPQ